MITSSFTPVMMRLPLTPGRAKSTQEAGRVPASWAIATCDLLAANLAPELIFEYGPAGDNIHLCNL